LKIFIVDDSAMLRTKLTAMLTRTPGFDVIGEAADVPGAVAAIAALQPDAVILDIHIPGGSGLDVLLEMRRRGNSALVIVLTNFPSRQYREHSFANGADYFFDKTTEFREVPRILREHAGKGRPRTVPIALIDDR
jgi:two-component system, NarL family, response regulator DevR